MKTYNGPRSKFSLLPHQIRWRAYNLLQDGATLKALTADPEIKDALARAGMKLSSANLAGIRKGKEYADFCAHLILFGYSLNLCAGGLRSWSSPPASKIRAENFIRTTHHTDVNIVTAAAACRDGTLCEIAEFQRMILNFRDFPACKSKISAEVMRSV